jgi:hypothetical protein
VVVVVVTQLLAQVVLVAEVMEPTEIAQFQQQMEAQILAQVVVEQVLFHRFGLQVQAVQVLSLLATQVLHKKHLAER